ncbi:MAG TPA: ATP-binding cassette domain-containing protein [Chitinivibrionales bacterium]|nr:ATP-binding cassette domain-containing protein [Chitinivibrionales bacterium]
MTLERFSVRVKAGQRTVVSAANYGVFQDEVTFLFGESGIGKSMVSKAVYGLLDPDELSATVNDKPYTVYLDDAEVKEIKKNSFFVFQEPSSHLNSLLKISDQLNEGSLRLSKDEAAIMERLWQDADVAAIRRILDVFPKPYRPSGGEKQRVLLAMAFKKIDVLMRTTGAGGRSFFVFDEPTGSLDNRYRNLFLGLLFEKYAKRPFTVMIITHDYSIISELYANYRPLLPRIHLQELRRKEGAEVEVVDFSAQDYLSWLGEAPAGSSFGVSETPVLNFGARFTVFGRNLCLYKDPAHTKEADLEINKGEMVYVKAPSGVGKTTLAKVIMGLYPAQKFGMTLCGLRLTEKTPKKIWSAKIWGKKAGMVFQHADESLNLAASVKETFDGLPLSEKLTLGRLSQVLSELFDGKITQAFLAKKVAMLSGGQKQRLNLLRTIVLATDLLILDEPLNGLDFLSVKKVLSILDKKRSEGTAMLMISHNEEIFDHFVDKEHVYYLAEV